MQKLALTLALVAMVAVPLAAEAKGGPKGNKGGNAAEPSAQVSVSVQFGSDAELTIRNYFRANPMVPEGLPPGMYNRLAKGKPLPPGIAKRFVPDGLRAQLPTYPDCDVVIVGRDVLLIAAATSIVLDILHDVL